MSPHDSTVSTGAAGAAAPRDAGKGLRTLGLSVAVAGMALALLPVMVDLAVGRSASEIGPTEIFAMVLGIGTMLMGMNIYSHSRFNALEARHHELAQVLRELVDLHRPAPEAPRAARPRRSALPPARPGPGPAHAAPRTPPAPPASATAPAGASAGFAIGTQIRAETLPELARGEAAKIALEEEEALPAGAEAAPVPEPPLQEPGPPTPAEAPFPAPVAIIEVVAPSEPRAREAEPPEPEPLPAPAATTPPGPVAGPAYDYSTTPAPEAELCPACGSDLQDGRCLHCLASQKIQQAYGEVSRLHSAGADVEEPSALLESARELFESGEEAEAIKFVQSARHFTAEIDKNFFEIRRALGDSESARKSLDKKGRDVARLSMLLAEARQANATCRFAEARELLARMAEEVQELEKPPVPRPSDIRKCSGCERDVMLGWVKCPYCLTPVNAGQAPPSEP